MEVKYIAIHCSATKEGKDYHATDIDKWHRERGFKKIGYHYVITLDGIIEQGRKLDEVGAHVQGYNSVSLGVCYIGGLDENGKPKDTRTEAQKQTLIDLLTILRGEYPDAIIQGHRDFSPDVNGDGIITPDEFIKDCPCFDAKKNTPKFKKNLKTLVSFKKQYLYLHR